MGSHSDLGINPPSNIFFYVKILHNFFFGTWVKKKKKKKTHQVMWLCIYLLSNFSCWSSLIRHRLRSIFLINGIYTWTGYVKFSSDMIIFQTPPLSLAHGYIGVAIRVCLWSLHHAEDGSLIGMKCRKKLRAISV